MNKRLLKMKNKIAIILDSIESRKNYEVFELLVGLDRIYRVVVFSGARDVAYLTISELEFKWMKQNILPKDLGDLFHKLADLNLN